MKKILLAAFVITTLAGCKKEAKNKIVPSAADSIYLVSTATENNTTLSGTETFTYDDQHRIIKDAIYDYLSHAASYYTFTYNSDGTLASIYYSVAGGGTLNFAYQNGLPVGVFPGNNPSDITAYTTTGGNVTRINYPIPTPNTINYRHYITYAYDANKNITATVMVNKTDIENAITIDSIRTFHNYTAHKSAFCNANVNFILTPGWEFSPLPGKNTELSTVEIDFNASGSDFGTISSDSVTYNKADMPLKVIRTFDYQGVQSSVTAAVYTYIEVKK